LFINKQTLIKFGKGKYIYRGCIKHRIINLKVKCQKSNLRTILLSFKLNEKNIFLKVLNKKI